MNSGLHMVGKQDMDNMKTTPKVQVLQYYWFVNKI
jgi:hypothetical protein